MRGFNEVWISGNVGSKIVIGKTKDDRPCCSWSVASENEKHRLTWARVNAYDALAEYCNDMLEKGVYCSVVGELMNRGGQYGELTEIRAQQVVFHKVPDSSVNQEAYSDEPEGA